MKRKLSRWTTSVTLTCASPFTLKTRAFAPAEMLPPSQGNPAELPPSITPMLKLLRGSFGASSCVSWAARRTRAWIALGEPKSFHEMLQ